MNKEFALFGDTKHKHEAQPRSEFRQEGRCSEFGERGGVGSMAPDGLPSRHKGWERNEAKLSKSIQAVLWILGLGTSVYVDLPQLYILVSVLVTIVLSLRDSGEPKTKKHMSAYSVFNQDGQRIPGEFGLDWDMVQLNERTNGGVDE